MRTESLALAAALFAAAAAPAADPPVVFQTQPPGRILADVRSIAKMIGGERAVKAFDDGLREKLGEKGLDGIDLDRPILGYVSLGAKLDAATAVVLIPVTGEKEFLALVERVGGEKPKPGAGGLHDLTPPGGDGKVLLRFAERHAYLGVGKDPTAALDPKALVGPAKLHDPSEKALAAARVHFDRLPKELRDQIADGLKQLKAELAAVKLPEEASEPLRKAVDELVALGTRYADLIRDAESAGARVILDAESGEAAVEVGLTGKPGSPLAKAIADRRPNTNKFAGLLTPDTVAGLRLQLPLFAGEIQKAAVIGLEAGQKALEEKAPPQFKGLIGEAFKGLTRTVNDGEFDLAVSFRGPDKDGLFTLVGAVAFEDPSGVEKELRALIKSELPPEVRAIINLDIAQVGKTNIHQAKVGPFLPPEVQKVFGEDASLTLAFAPTGIFVALGPDAVNTMKAALEVKKAPAAPFEVALNPARLAKVLTAFGKEVPPGFGKQDKLIPAVLLTLDGGKELRLRLGTNLKLFEGLGAGLADE